MFEEILNAIKRRQIIILHRHSNPDGDALGSQIGLKHLIQENYPNKTVWMVGDGAGRYDFMADSEMDIVPDDAYRDALAIVLDTSAASLISDKRYETAAETARIDHHIFLCKLTEWEAVDSSYESCCGLVTQMALECGWRMNTAAATALYTGMVTDSGRFRYDSTTARTFRLASVLLEQSVDINAIYRELYAVDYAYALVRAKFMLHVCFTASGVAYVYSTLDDKRDYGVDDFTLSRGMVNCMADLRGVDIWVNFTECEAGVLCEIRSSRLNINPIAVKYSGGGHAKASGAMLKSREDAMRMLKDFDNLIEENRKNGHSASDS